tara:strand:- start:138 stop:617 length:480 start_codon:yes stop_codon:yes gene_type:complete
MDIKKMLFAIDFVLSNVDSDMLDTFIDHRWCEKDWEDLRDEVSGEQLPESSANRVDYVEPIKVTAPPEITSEQFTAVRHALNAVFNAMASPSTDEAERVDGWGDDFTQFTRLIAEAEAVGMWTNPVIEKLANEMDLVSSDVVEIIDRAQRSWDLIKKGI